MLYIHIACDDNEFIYQTFAVHVSQLCLLLLYIYVIARESLISIAITLAINVFIYCKYTPKALNMEFVKVIKIILCSYQ